MHNQAIRHTQPVKLLSHLAAGSYTWLVTVSLGVVLLDILYARLVPEAAAAFSDVSDLLLLVAPLTLLAGLGAIAFSWDTPPARNLFIASLCVILAGPFIAALLSAILRDAQGALWGSGLRITLSALTSILASIGLYNLYRRG